MPDLYDSQTGKKLRLKSGDEAAQAFASGQAGFAPGQRVHVLSPDGQIGTIDAAEAQEALSSGYRIAGDIDVEKARIQQEHGTGLETVKAGAEGAARGLTFGLSDAALTEAGLVESEDLKARKEANPGVALGSELAGSLAPLLATGGTSGAATGASLAARAGQATRVAGAVPRGTAALGQAAERTVQGLLGSRANTLLGKAASVGAGGVVEGAVVGAGQAVSTAALDDAELTAEQMVAGAAEGALLGGGAGAALGGGVVAARRTSEGVAELFSRAKVSEHFKTLEGSTGFAALKGPAGGKEWVEAADEIGGIAEVGRRNLEMGLIGPTSTIDDIAEATAAKSAELGEEFAAAARRIAPEAVEDALDEAAFKSITGPKTGGKKWLKQADRFHGGDKAVGKRLRRLGVADRNSDLQTIHDNAVSILDDVGTEISGVLKRMDAVGLPKPTNEKLHQAVETDVLAPMTRSGSAQQKRFAASIRRELESRGVMRRTIEVQDADGAWVKQLEPPREFSLEELSNARGAVQKELAKYDVSTKAAVTDGYRKAARVMNDELEQAVDAAAQHVGDDIAKQYRDLKKDYAAVSLARDASADSLQSAAARADTDIASGVTKAFDDADAAIEKQFDELVARSAPDDAEQLLELKRNFQSARLGAMASKDGAARAGANRSLSMSDMQFAQATGIGGSMAFGFDPGTLVMAVASGYAHKLLRTRGAAFFAGGLQNLKAAKQVTQRALQVERAMDSAVLRFFDTAKSFPKRAVPIAAAQQGESRRERYDKVTAKLRDVTPERLVDEVTQRMGASGDERLTAAYTGTVMRGAEFLRSKMPQRRSLHVLRPDLVKAQRVADSEMSKFLRYAEAVENPMTVIEDLERGEVSREGAEVLRAVYPKMHAALIQRVTDLVSQAEEPLPYSRVRQLSIVLGTPLHFSLTGEFVRFSQSRYSEDQATAHPSPDGPEPMLSPSRRDAPEFAQHVATKEQARQLRG